MGGNLIIPGMGVRIVDVWLPSGVLSLSLYKCPTFGPYRRDFKPMSYAFLNPFDRALGSDSDIERASFPGMTDDIHR